MRKEKYLMRHAQRAGERCKPVMHHEGNTLFELRVERLLKISH